MVQHLACHASAAELLESPVLEGKQRLDLLKRLEQLTAEAFKTDGREMHWQQLMPRGPCPASCTTTTQS